MSHPGHFPGSRVPHDRADGVCFRFRTFQFAPGQWGYELLRANGDSASAIADPNWGTEPEAIDAIHRDAEQMQIVPGYGWCVVDQPAAPRQGPR